ncbi:hypothetical protein AB0K51_22575 [Kitasatospora sp. NPDC049285]|uniref:trypsin-like serine peptidase n=1 Tax=Kitasatospora sp. NPDC049285 TaxID=3157096 RepID=UPI00341BCAB2
MTTTTHRTPRRGRAAAAAALVTVLALTATACQNDDPKPGVAASGTASKPSIDLKDIQDALAKVASWTADDWADWASKHGFKPEDVAALKDFWDQGKLNSAKGVKPKEANVAQAKTPTRAEVVFPNAIPAKAQPHPYNPDTAVVGKIFMQIAADSYAECSGTVVADPQHPGKSNLVWTAAHCVHEGKGGDYFKKISFVPAYNKAGAASNGRKGTFEQVAPLGVWAARNIYVMPQWGAEGGEKGGPASQFDFAVIRVVNQNGGSKSLEETVGGAVPIWFGAQPDQITTPSAYGYPADDPFDGQELEHCDSAAKPTPYVYDASRPPMLSIGCTMTGGSSGGGWFTRHDGKLALFSNTSVGNTPTSMLAGPNLGQDAKRMFDAFLQSKQQ